MLVRFRLCHQRVQPRQVLHKLGYGGHLSQLDPPHRKNPSPGARRLLRNGSRRSLPAPQLLSQCLRLLQCPIGPPLVRSVQRRRVPQELRRPRPAAALRTQQPSLAVPPAATWQWPIRGPVVSAYGAASGTGSGIGIGGQFGAEIRASAAGEVVYAGDGLAAYGNLIIIKHNDTFLSAYGHNDELMVGESDSVEQGDVIARMGMGPERQPQVHFEIRRNGTPVDPLAHLPN